MEIKRSDPLSKVNPSVSARAESLSVMGASMAFLFGLFRRKEKERNNEKFSREEQVMSGIIAADELMGEISKKMPRRD